MAGLNIKDEETYRLVRQLSALTGETLTMAIKVAVTERLDRTRPREKEGLKEWLEEVTKHTAEAMNDGPSSAEIGDFLYDKETGLPK